MYGFQLKAADDSLAALGWVSFMCRKILTTFIALFVAASIIALDRTPAYAQKRALPPASAYTEEEQLRAISLSPDGRKLAFVRHLVGVGIAIHVWLKRAEMLATSVTFEIAPGAIPRPRATDRPDMT